MPEQQSNNPKTLHELVSNRTDDGKNRKVVGYSVASYAGVLSALEKAKMIVKNGETITDGGLSYGGGQNVISRSWTFLGNYGVGNTGIVDNFYQSDLNQVKVILRDYMPFVLDCKNEDGKFERTCVKRRDYAHLEFLNRGISVSCSQNPQFPPGDFTKDSLERCKNGLGTDGDGFIIGLGVAFNQVVINYFRHFYEKIEWTEDKLRSLAAKGYLYGELMVPKGDNAKVLHARITVDISQSETSPYDVFVPVPLMLLDDFKELGYVRVRNNTKEEDVDGKTLLFHLASKKFNHKKSIIEGFGPDGIKDYVPGNVSRDVEYRYTGLNGGNIVEGRLRFYFIPESKEEVARIAGSIPEEYKEKLFRGVISEDGYYKTESVVYEMAGIGTAAEGLKTDSAFYYEGQVDWAKFRQKHPNLPAGHEDIIESVARQFNINTRMWMTQMGLETGWFTSKNFKSRRNPGGISAESIYKGGQTYTLDYLGGVRATRAVEVRGEGYGHYWIFETYEDGYRAMAYLLVNSKRYGLAKFGAQTVYEHFTNMYRGGYCDLREAVCQNYNDKLMNQYANIC